MGLLESFLGRSGYLPHGYCVAWSPELLWSMVGADSVIALAYFSIPLAILRFTRGRSLAPYQWVAGLFVTFIFACGLTHVMDVWTVWNPDYGVQALVKIGTAAASIATAIVLWPLIPQALKIPSVEQLQRAVTSLEAEVGRRRTAEQHLLDLDQSLALSLASLGAGFIATDRQGRVTRMNAVAERVTGWTQDEAHGRSVWEIYRREDRPAGAEQQSAVELMIERGVTVETTHRVVVVSRRGTRTPIELNADVTRNDDGSVRGMVMVFRDMTRLSEAESEVRRLAAIVESSNDAIISKTLDGRITSWNQGAELLFGYRADEAIGQPVQMLMPPELQREEMRILSDLAAGKAVPTFPTVRLTKGGRRIDVSESVSPVRDARGRIVGGAKITRDITPQRRYEAALRDSEAKLRFALDSAAIGDWEIDLATGATRRSARYDRCFGYDVPRAEWSFRRMLRHVHRDDRGLVVRTFRAAVIGRHDWHVECRVVWPDGSVHWITLHGRVQRDRAGALRMLGIVADVTAARQEEAARLKVERLEAENRQIQEASQLKSQFLANMSHELRTPLNAVIGFADLLCSGAVPADSPKHHRFLSHIASSGRHLLQLINDVLDLSKVESGKFEFFPEPVQLTQLAREIADVLHDGIEKKRLALTIDVDPGLDDLVLDPARLKQVLYNYLSNAIKFTPDDGRVTLRARPEGSDHVRIEVEDSGIGIEAHDLPRLFIEFQQLDAGYSKRHQGTGLGLALTRRLVQAQGGSVGVSSVPGVGSVFHLVLPRRYSAAAAAGGAQPRVLVIERNPALQTRWRRLLGEAGYRTEAAGTAEEALHQARGQGFDAITLGLVLPDRDGLDALLAIRSGGPSQTAPVVGVSMTDEGGNAATFAVADLLAKPIRSEQVLAAMQRLQPPPRRVMVVDDDAQALELMRATLGGIGIDVVALQDGRQALRELDRHRPDAIVLDLMMPTFDGFEVLDALQQLPAWRMLPVFIWTSMVLTEDEYARLARSARAIIGKGGGALSAVLDGLRRQRVPAEAER